MENQKIRKGICRNYGDCSKASDKEIIEVREGEPFECPECQQPLTEVDDKGKPINRDNGKKKRKPKVNPIVYIVGAVILLLLGLVIWWICKPSSLPAEPVQTEPVVIEDPASAQPDTLQTETEETIDTIVPQEAVTTEPEKPAAETSLPATPKPAATGVHKLSYGTWKGGWKNGKPHGEGTLTYTSETLIDPRDSKQRVANPGEYVIGTWDEGHLVHGRWFKNDGSKEAVVIGKAG